MKCSLGKLLRLEKTLVDDSDQEPLTKANHCTGDRALHLPLFTLFKEVKPPLQATSMEHDLPLLVGQFMVNISHVRQKDEAWIQASAHTDKSVSQLSSFILWEKDI